MTYARPFMRLFAAALLVGVAMVAGGCGVRGPLEAPIEAKATGQTATGETPADPGKDSAEKPHKPFILDPLLR